MHVRRLSWCKCAGIFARSPDRRYLSQWKRRCTRRLPFARHSPLIATRVESTRKPNPIARQTDSTGQYCNKARKRLSPSIKRVDNTPTTFLAGNCRNNGRRCSSTLLCSSSPIARCFCKSSRMPASCQRARKPGPAASSTRRRSAASQDLCCTLQVPLKVDRFCSRRELIGKACWKIGEKIKTCCGYWGLFLCDVCIFLWFANKFDCLRWSLKNGECLEKTVIRFDSKKFEKTVKKYWLEKKI